MVTLICISTFVSNSAYMLIAPFLPLEFKMKGVSQDMVGIIFGTFAAARLISPFFLGLLGEKVN